MGGQSILVRTPPRQAVDWAVRMISASGRVVSVEPMLGGVSHANHALTIEAGSGGAIREVVLRRWVRPDWAQTDPQFSPAQEAATYRLLASSAVPAPRLLAADVDGSECDVPALLLSRAPGTRVTEPPERPSFLRQLAGALPLVHGLDPARAARTVPPYRPYYGRDQLDVPAWSSRPAVWERAIELATGPQPGERAAFIHRDYHPGNTLWASGKLTAIIDWTTASWGPPSVDVAHMRANLAMSFGLETADAFRDAYGEVVGGRWTLDPYWDVRIGVDLLPELPLDGFPAGALGRLEDLVARAVAQV